MDENKDSGIVRMKKADDWFVAATVSEERAINTPNGPVKFKVRALSYGEYEAIRDATPDPKPPERKGANGVVEEDAQDPGYLRAMAESEYARYVAVADKCWSPIPGDTLQAKIAWAQSLSRPSDFAGLYVQIMALSGVGTGQQEVLPVGAGLITSPEQWFESAKAPTQYVFKRAERQVVFEVRGISAARVKAIEAATDPGQPPMVKVARPGRHLPREPREIEQPNTEDPTFKARARQMQRFQNTMLLEAALFDFPGGTIEEKAKWLDDRPAGEVMSLLRFLKYDVLAYRGMVDFT